MYNLDKTIFEFINQTIANGFLDIVLPFSRNKTNWVPLYIIIILWIFYKYSWKKSLAILAFVGGTVGISDTLSSKIIKYSVQRPRPCHEESGLDNIRLLIDCGSGYSFTSSHATNHFAIAIFLGFLLQLNFKFSLRIFIAWASIVSLAQVYVGVHYPSDILAGGIIGTIIGYMMFKIYQILENKYFPSIVS